jgi:hypothetical protein
MDWRTCCCYWARYVMLNYCRGACLCKDRGLSDCNSRLLDYLKLARQVAPPSHLCHVPDCQNRGRWGALTEGVN